MEKPVKPMVYPLRSGEFVTIPVKAWNALYETIVQLIDVVNEHESKLEQHSKDISDCTANLAKVAEIMEDIYENFD